MLKLVKLTINIIKLVKMELTPHPQAMSYFSAYKKVKLVNMTNNIIKLMKINLTPPSPPPLQPWPHLVPAKEKVGQDDQQYYKVDQNDPYHPPPPTVSPISTYKKS